MVVTQNLVTLPAKGFKQRQLKKVTTFITICVDMVKNVVKVWVLDDKGKKSPSYFLVDGYEPVDAIGMEIRV